MKVTDHRPVVSRFKRFSLSAVVASAAIFGAVDASAHGYVSSPKSRVIMCKENGIENPTLPACIAAKNAGNVTTVPQFYLIKRASSEVRFFYGRADQALGCFSGSGDQINSIESLA